MEDSFNVRVGKIFGSLSSSSSSAESPSSLSSLWCLTDDEIERRRWNRDKPSPEDQDDLQDLEEEDEQEQDGLQSKEDESDWDIKASIGLDSTLDYEEEEDEYDKVAVGREKAEEDRVYMRDVMDRDFSIDTDTDSGFRRDPRANHLAAKIRLKEDSDTDIPRPILKRNDNDAANAKPILKRKDNDTANAKPAKRVRFDPNCHFDQQQCHHHPVAPPPNPAPALPDYLLNPSRYTRYTFDSSTTDVNDHSNKLAYMDFLSTLPARDAAAFDPTNPAAVTFIPRKKTADMIDSCTQLVQQVGIGKDARRLVVAADADQEDSSTLCAMEEDEPDKTPLQKSGRQYRVKPRSDSEDD